jgi:hypothetical protein
MREETIVKYIADDGVAFKDRLDCLHYEKLCTKYKNWLYDGRVKFWSRSEKYLNFDLWAGDPDATKYNYIDWLKQRLSNDVGYIIINEDPNETGWANVWDFIVKFCNFDEDDIRRIETTYCKGDLINYDWSDCGFHNISHVVRNVLATKETLMSSYTQELYKRDKEEENEGTC